MQQSGQFAHGSRRGGSSFRILDPDKVFEALGDISGFQVLELGCGPGDYTRRLSAAVGLQGSVLALDKNSLNIKELEPEAALLGNVRVLEHDILQPLPVESGSVDLCLVATVLHIFGLARAGEVFAEVLRALAPGGRLAVVECKKEDQPWGPPIERRISEQELADAAGVHGFVVVETVDLGKAYLAMLGRTED